MIEEMMREEAEREEWCSWAWDDVNDKELKLADVRAGRKEEVTFMINRGIWRIVHELECWEKTGKAPTTVKWVDTMKDGGLARCRLVARDFKGKGGETGRIYLRRPHRWRRRGY